MRSNSTAPVQTSAERRPILLPHAKRSSMEQRTPDEPGNQARFAQQVGNDARMSHGRSTLFALLHRDQGFGWQCRHWVASRRKSCAQICAMHACCIPGHNLQCLCPESSSGLAQHVQPCGILVLERLIVKSLCSCVSCSHVVHVRKQHLQHRCEHRGSAASMCQSMPYPVQSCNGAFMPLA